MNQYLVKALLSRQGKSATLRFVPLEIFELWKQHMQNNHDYQVRLVQVSLWVGTRESENDAPKPAGSPKEPVVKVSISKKVGGVEVPVERYFPEADVDRVLPKFLAHYGLTSADSMDAARVRMERGIFLPSEDVFEDEL
jgi:hypothetical protein